MSGEAHLAIEVTGLHKRYGEVEAVTGVDLSVAIGEVVAFLGPNGAGKTTTVEILEGLRTRTSGDVQVLGVDPAEATANWRERIGVVLQGAKHEGDFTAAEIVTMWSAYYRSPRPTPEVLELVGLAEAAGTRTRRLSGGQQQRLAVALALVGDPELVFLDEPTTGFDPAARREAWQTIDGLRSLGVTVLLTTHYMDEADQLADRIAVISRGRIVADGTALELAAQVAMPSQISWDAAELSPGVLPDRLRDLLRGQDASMRSRTAVGTAAVERQTERQVERPALATRDVDEVVRELLGAAEAAGTRLDSLAVQPPTLEDTYLALTGDSSSGDGS
ncbi:ABC transporter ATP-binding protein [Candidatus Poriferisodalis sp.]|uniref:ABC transporter ATP-binding protein n=1 Tax=Candidatus Poriferisodalis sp. TaxID=3101277 RepID=UPI003B58EE64